MVESDIARFHVLDRDFEILQKILSKDPKDGYAYFLLGRCFERNGLMDMANEQYDISRKVQARPEDILRRLKRHIEDGDLSEAFTVLPIAREKAPDDPNIALVHAIFLQSNGVVEDAQSELSALMHRSDCPLGAATALATIYLEKGRFDEAMHLADRDIALNPHYLPAQIVKGHAALSLGKARSAIQTLKQPLLDNPYSRRLNLILYDAYRHEGDFDNALRCALRNLAASDYTSYFEQAQNNVQEMVKLIPKGKTRQIVAEISRELDKTNLAMKFHFFLGQVFFRLRRGNDAFEQLQTALNMDPGFQPNWYEMGRIKEVFFCDYRGAGADFKKAHELQRSDYKAIDAFMRLSSRVRNEKRDIAWKLKMIGKGQSH